MGDGKSVCKALLLCQSDNIMFVGSKGLALSAIAPLSSFMRIRILGEPRAFDARGVVTGRVMARPSRSIMPVWDVAPYDSH